MNKFINSFLQQKGIIILRNTQFNTPKGFKIGNYTYGITIPNANFSPWKNDGKFLSVFNKINSNTLVDIYRLYELWQLVDEILKISTDLNIIEIGVWRGGTASIMATKMNDKNARGTIFCRYIFRSCKNWTK